MIIGLIDAKVGNKSIDVQFGLCLAGDLYLFSNNHTILPNILTVYQNTELLNFASSLILKIESQI